MTVFTSKATIDKPVSEVYQFLADMNNHQQLMPENITDWASTADEARFNIQNMASLALKINDRVVDSQITIISIERPPFDLELQWQLAAVDNTTEVTYTISADLSMMMKMLASGPLQKLADHETQSLNKALS
ncbi:MAG: SRPBCC family protein [Mucilaginibacter sp.]